jgi:hypothetical protein
MLEAEKITCVAVPASSHSNSATRAIAASTLAGLASLDAATTTQVIYSASSVAERKAGTVQDLQCWMEFFCVRGSGDITSNYLQ